MLSALAPLKVGVFFSKRRLNLKILAAREVFLTTHPTSNYHIAAAPSLVEERRKVFTEKTEVFLQNTSCMQAMEA